MLHFPRQPTIKSLILPIESLVIEGSLCPVTQGPFAGFLLKFKNDGVIDRSHPYVDSVRYAWRLKHHDDPLVLERKVEENLLHDIRRFKDFDPLSETEIPVRLKADGQFEILDGHHRVVMAWCSGQKTLRVAVKYVSPAWMALENELLRVSKTRFLYQQIEHPWFLDWQVMRSSTDHRAAAIMNFLSSLDGIIPTKVHYDIGCCTGHLARCLKRAGLAVLGIDNREEHIRIADYLNIIFGVNIPFYLHDDFLSLLDDDIYDHIGSISCLSVLHHWLATGQDERYRDAVEKMASKCWVLFIDQVNEEQQFITRKQTNIPLNADGYERWLRDVIGCRSVCHLGTHEWGRPLFAASLKMDF